MKNNKGVTLIALIITIIVLLILAAVGITMVVGQNGILSRAKEAKATTEYKSAEEKVGLAVSSAIAKSNYGELTTENLKEEVEKYNGTISRTEFPVTVTMEGYQFKVDSKGIITQKSSSEEMIASSAFDQTGKEQGKLHVGDFINYTPENDTWTSDEINNIITNSKKNTGANNLYELPSEAYEFGGFTEGGSKSGNARPSQLSYDYIKDTSGQAVTGWRLFDMDNEKITLISTGCPEDFRHLNDGYVSEYILTGNKNSKISSEDNQIIDLMYLARDWSMYKNSAYKTIDVKPITKEDLDNWYTKYITNGVPADTFSDGDYTTFWKVYKTKYENLIDNYSFYWLATASDSGNLYQVYPDDQRIYSGMSSSCAYGVRLLITIPNNIKISANGTKTIDSYNNDYEYNVWDLIQE